MFDNKSPNQLGEEKIRKLLWQYSLPAIVGTTATSLYNIIDRVFIGHGVGELAISGLALTFPIMNLTIAFGALVGAGSSTMVSILLGEKKRERAMAVLCNALMLNITISLAVSMLMLFFLNEILYAFGASTETLPYARDFSEVVLAGTLFSHIYFGMNNILRSSGYPRKAMMMTLATVGINTALAPLYIFVFDWGIRGAAFATVCSYVAGAAMVLWHFVQKKHYVHLERKLLHWDFSIVKDIFAIGVSPFSMNLCAAGVALLMNLSLKQYGGDLAIGAFGVIGAVVGLFAMVMFGLNQGMQPIAGYNYGAHNHERVMRVFRLALIAGTVLCTAGFLIGELCPRLIARAFTDSPVMIEHVAVGMRLSMLMFPIVGFQMVSSAFFQSIGKAKISLVLTLSRQLLFLIPMLLLFPRLWHLNGVWLSMSASDFAAALVTAFVLAVQIKKLNNQSSPNPPKKTTASSF